MPVTRLLRLSLVIAFAMASSSDAVSRVAHCERKHGSQGLVPPGRIHIRARRVRLHDRELGRIR